MSASYPSFTLAPILPNCPTVLPYRRISPNGQDTVDGMFFFGAAGSDAQLAASNASYAQVAREMHKLSMASVTPFYWGTAQPGRRFFETHGGQGTRQPVDVRSLKTSRIS